MSIIEKNVKLKKVAPKKVAKKAAPKKLTNAATKPIAKSKANVRKIVVPEDVLLEFRQADPSKSRYCVKWMKEQFEQGVRKEDIIPTVKMFWGMKERMSVEQRELYFWKSASDLENKLKDMGESNRSKRHIIKNEGALEILREPNLLLVRLETKEGAQFWGKDTRWCVSMKTGDYFRSYMSDNCQRLYVAVIDKEKYAFLIGRFVHKNHGPYAKITTYNAKDESIYDSSVCKTPPPDVFLRLYKVIVEDYKGWLKDNPPPPDKENV